MVVDLRYLKIPFYSVEKLILFRKTKSLVLKFKGVPFELLYVLYSYILKATKTYVYVSHTDPGNDGTNLSSVTHSRFTASSKNVG